MSEIWLPVPGWEGEYDVSNLGRIRSWVMRKKEQPVIRSPRVGARGYLNICLWRNGESLCRSVHSLVALAFIGPRPPGSVIRHLDGTTDNNNATNLSYGTASANVLDEVRHGTHANASKNTCKSGHPFDADNTYIRPSGKRDCRACRRRWSVGRYQRLAAKQERMRPETPASPRTPERGGAGVGLAGGDAETRTRPADESHPPT
jgi:hypothetical protein